MLPVMIRRVVLATHRVDFRKRFDGLLGEAYRLGANPYDGDCVVFVKRDRRELRAMVGDDFGLYLVNRRFESSSLRAVLAFSQDPSCKTISSGELTMLLEGATFTVHSRARKWHGGRTGTSAVNASRPRLAP